MIGSDTAAELSSANNTQYLVQQFIDTGPRFAVFRNLTLFGETIYQNFALAPEAHPAQSQ